MRKYNNIPNEFVTKENIGDRGFFISRSVAVVTTVLVRHLPTNTMYVLMGKRGKGTPDFQGYWNMPCGYLDWNETGTDALFREVFEETGLDLESLIDSETLVDSHIDQPWYVNFYPDSNRQNVTLRFGACITTKNEMPKLTNENCEPGEVEELKWVNVNDIEKHECAFNHEKLLNSYMLKTNFR